MKIRVLCIYGSGAFIRLVDDHGRNLGFDVHGMDEAYRVLAEHSTDDEATVAMVRGDIATTEHPLRIIATEPTTRFEGMCVHAFGAMLAHAARAEDGDRPPIPDPGALGFMFTPSEEGYREGIIGYCDANGAYCVDVFFSRHQASQLLETIPWLTTRSADEWTRLRRMLFDSRLPANADQPAIAIRGELAEKLVHGYDAYRAAKETGS